MNTQRTDQTKKTATAVLKLTNQMDIRLQLLLVCTAVAITAAGLTA